MKDTQNFLLVFALILFVGLGCSSSGTRTGSTQPSGSIKSFVSATTADTTADASNDQASLPGKATAKVISINANLRKTANSSGAVIQSLPEGISVAVIKQRGAWFYVRADGGQTGWLHGNTIKLIDSKPASPIKTTDEDSTQEPLRIPKAKMDGDDYYHLGPRGGCYVYTKTGNKRYVDRSLCH